MAKQTVDSTASGSDRYGASARSPLPPETDPVAGDTAASPGAAFSEFSRQLGEAWLFIGYYLRTRLDQLRLSIFRLILLAVLGVVGLLAGGAMIATAAVLVVIGFSDLIAWLTGYRWIGEMVTGIVLLGAVAAATYWAVGRVTRTSRTATLKDHERHLREQREYYGTDVNERAHRN